MMDNEIVIVGENMMDQNDFIYYFKKINFMNNVKQSKKYCHAMNVNPPAQLLSTTLYIYFMENWDALKINDYKKNPIVIYDSRLFKNN